MSLTMFLPLGILIAVIGAVLYFRTARKLLAAGVLVFGLGIAGATALLVVLVMNSNM